MNRQLAKRVIGSVIGGLAAIDGASADDLQAATADLLAGVEFWRAIGATVSASNAARAARAKQAKVDK